MRLTYGDLSETDLDFDPLALTRAVVEYTCDVMRAAQRVEHRRAAQSRAGGSVRAWSQEASALKRRLQNLMASEVDDGALRDDIEHSLEEAIGRQTERRREATLREQQRLDDEIIYERQRCLEALAPLLCGFSLPGTSARLALRNDHPGYRASLTTRTELATGELAAEFALDVGTSFASGNRTLGSFARNTSLRVPVRGWFGRPRVKAVDLGACVIQSLTHSADGTVLVLRSTGRRPVEYRLERDDEGLAVSATDESPIGALSLVGADARQADDLLDALATAAVPLAERRTKLLAAHLSGTDVAELCDVEIVALGLVETVAPLVRELWEHSPGDEELAIGVAVAHGAPEMRTLSLATLRDAIAPLDPNQRGVFASWGLPLAGAPLTGTGIPEPGRLARGSAPPPPRLPNPLAQPAAPKPRQPEAPRLSTVDLDSGWA